MRSKLSCLVVAVTVAATPALAHHSFTMFDMTKRVTLMGTLTSFEWTNPHAYIEIDVPGEDGGPSTGASKWAAPAF